MQILHIASHEINIGDGMLNFCLRKKVEEMAPECVEWTLHDVHCKSTLSEAELSRFDKILIGGGGGIDGLSNPETSGMAANIDVTACSLRTLQKMHIIALGYNLYYGQSLNTKAVLEKTLAAILRAGGSVSLRNDGSLDRLIASGVPDCISGAISVVADPGFLVGHEPILSQPFSTPRPYIALNLATDNIVRRVKPAFDRRGIRRLVKKPLSRETATCVIELVRSAIFDRDVVFVPHTLRDLEIFGDIVGGLTNPVVRRHVFVAPVMPTDSWQQLFSIYSYAQLSIVMRGHALIYCLAKGLPVSVISTHPKIEAMAGSYGVNTTNGFSDISAELLGARSECYVDRRSVNEKYISRLEQQICKMVSG